MHEGPRTLLRLFIAVACIPVLCSCVKRPGPSVPLDEAVLSDPRAVYQEILHNGEQARTMRATARLRLQTRREKVSADAVILCDRAGRVRIEILDWLNHVVFLALFGPQGFLAYSVPENRYMQGPDEAVSMQEMLGIPLTTKSLAVLALGDPFFLPVENPKVSLSVDHDSLLLDVEGADRGPRYLVWLDEKRRPKRMLVVRPRSGGRMIGDLQVEYGGYRKIDSIWFPYRVLVTDGGSQGVLDVGYERVSLDEPLEEGLFHFVPPPGATQATELIP